MPLSPLPVDFYNRSALDVAHDLLGKLLVRQNGRMAGYITETEAYMGESDLACHARAGRTPRTEIMYGPPGYAYIYFIYGMHWMLNAVTEPEGTPAAVLIRAIWPIYGLDIIAANRPKVSSRDWTNGPARLCRALEIDGRLNGANLADPREELFITPGSPVSPQNILRTARVGIQNVPEPWRSLPWRFSIDQNTWTPNNTPSAAAVEPPATSVAPPATTVAPPATTVAPPFKEN